jgi:hypothetical protein
VAEVVSFELRLVDAVSAGAKRQAAALRAVEGQAKKAQSALDFSKEIGRASHALQRLQVDPAGYKKLIAAQRQLADERKKLVKQVEGGGFFKSFGHALPFRSLGDYTKGAFWGSLAANAVTAVVGGFVEGASAAVRFLEHGIKMAFEEGSKAENLRLGYSLTLGGKAGAESLADVARFSGQTGFDDDKLAQMMLPMRRAGFSQQAARTNMAIALDAAAGLGKGGDEGTVSGILGGLTDIKHRGAISKKQLNSMGLSDQTVPDFYKELGKQLKVSAKQAEQMAGEGGKVDPQLIINILGRSIEKQQGGQLGTGAEKYAKTMEARLSKLSDLPSQFLKKISESPAWEKLAGKVGEFLERMDPDGPEGQRIVGALMSAFERLEGFVERVFTAENVDKFSAGVATAVEWVSKLPEMLSKVLAIAEALVAIWAGKKLIDGIMGATKAIEAFSAASAGGGVTGALGKFGAVAAAGGAGYALGTAADQYFGISDKIGSIARSGENSADADFDKKYGGAGRPLQLRNSGGKPIVNAPISINIEHKGGEDHEEGARKAAHVYRRHMAAAAEQAAAEGG